MKMKILNISMDVKSAYQIVTILVGLIYIKLFILSN